MQSIVSIKNEGFINNNNKTIILNEYLYKFKYYYFLKKSNAKTLDKNINLYLSLY